MISRYMISPLVSLLIIAIIPTLPGYYSDVVIVPAGEIEYDLMEVRIEISDNTTLVSVNRNLGFHSYWDYELKVMTEVKGGRIIDAGSNDPMNSSLTFDEHRVIIRYIPEYEWQTDSRLDYHYLVRYDDVDGINLTDHLTTRYDGYRIHEGSYPYWSILYMIDHENEIEVRSNTDLSFYFYTHNLETGSTDRIFIENASELRSEGGSFLQICWNDGPRVADLNNTISCILSEKEVSYSDFLIGSEAVNIDIRYEGDDLLYYLDARFVLNATVLDVISPVRLWFPDNGTDCSATMDFSIHEGESVHALLNTTWEKSSLNSQKGFYIELPKELSGPDDRLLSDPFLNVTINGSLDVPWFDFVIVTVPLEDSMIMIHTPVSFDITSMCSTFEKKAMDPSSSGKTVCFSGRCLELGKQNIRWRIVHDRDGDSYLDDIDHLPDDPMEWNDTDMDGVGDNSDVFPIDPFEWNDTDEDGAGDNSDVFPTDPSASIDIDGDGHPDSWNDGRTQSDSTTGLTLDNYPKDPDRYQDGADRGSPILFMIAGILPLLILISTVIVIFRSYRHIKFHN